MYNTWESWIFEYQGKNRVWNWSSGLALKIAMITSTVDSIDLGRIVNNFMPGKVTLVCSRSLWNKCGLWGHDFILILLVVFSVAPCV